VPEIEIHGGWVGFTMKVASDFIYLKNILMGDAFGWNVELETYLNRFTPF